VNGWQLVSINQADLEPILAIEQNSFQRPWDRLSLEFALRCHNARNYAIKPTEGKSCGPFIAYAFLRLLGDDVHLQKVAVTPAWRGQGVASWLLERCFTLSVERGARSAHLEVRPSNIPAVELYQKLGFELAGKRPEYYTDSKEDALLMIKILKEDL